MIRSVCFTGHRKIIEDRNTLARRLYPLLEYLVAEKGITDFYTGGAIGFDALSARVVLILRERNPSVKLHLVLPCPFAEQSIKWTDNQKKEHKYIASLCDSQEITSEHYSSDAMKIRNHRLIEVASSCCICYWNPQNWRSGTGQTVRMAQRKGLEIINLFEAVSNI